MIAAVLVIPLLFVLWMLFFVIQFAAVLTLLALVTGLAVAVAVYGFSFFAFLHIFGESNIGWAVFAAMFVGSVILGAIVKSAKRLLNQQKAVSGDVVAHRTSSN